MKKTDVNHSISMNIFHCELFAILKKSVYSVSAAAKSADERDNSNYLHMANNSAPCAFFIRKLYTPKETVMQNCISAFLSMVACSGKGFALCCVPYVAVCHPVTRYRPSVTTQAVTSLKLHMELSAMIYLFKAVSRSDLRNTAKHYSDFPKYNVCINADSLADARAKIAPFFVVLGVVYA